MKRLTATTLLAAVASLAPIASWAENADPARDARVRQALERMEAEPSVLDVHRAALQYFRVNPQAVDRLRSASVRRAAAPTLRITGRAERLDANRDVVDPLVIVQTNDQFVTTLYGGEASLEWNLPGAVFNPAQLQAYALVGIQMNVLKEVTRLYYVRRQLLLSLLADPPDDARARIAMEMRVEEFTSLIDSFTGGWFSRHLPSSR